MNPMTRAQLRSELSAFRDMVRNRGPWELLEIAATWRFHDSRSSGVRDGAADWLWFGAALQVKRWWRWANRGDRLVVVMNIGGYEHWASD